MKIYIPLNEDKLKGGLADNLTLKDIAKHHDIDEEVLKKELDKGIKVEMEHVDNTKLSKEIAMDHLMEDPKYYTELEKLHKESIIPMELMGEVKISENLKYHINNKISLSENVFRYGSEAFFNLINEVRELSKTNNIILNEIDEELIDTMIGEDSIFEGENVWLDMVMEEDILTEEDTFKGKKTSSPSRDTSGGKAYKVYVAGCSAKTKSNPRGIKLIRFGSGGLKAKLNDKEAKKRYNKRHGCSAGRHNDKCKAGYYSCRLPRYAKKLNLSGGGTWW